MIGVGLSDSQVNLDIAWGRGHYKCNYMFTFKTLDETSSY